MTTELSPAEWTDCHGVLVCVFLLLFQLTRKNLTVKNLKRLRKNLERDVGRTEATKCDFFPRTFSLPSEYHIFVEEFKRTPGSTWIMKPVSCFFFSVQSNYSSFTLVRFLILMAN